MTVCSQVAHSTVFTLALNSARSLDPHTQSSMTSFSSSFSASSSMSLVSLTSHESCTTRQDAEPLSLSSPVHRLDSALHSAQLQAQFKIGHPVSGRPPAGLKSMRRCNSSRKQCLIWLGWASWLLFAVLMTQIAERESCLAWVGFLAACWPKHSLVAPLHACILRWQRLWYRLRLIEKARELGHSWRVCQDAAQAQQESGEGRCPKAAFGCANSLAHPCCSRLVGLLERRATTEGCSSLCSASTSLLGWAGLGCRATNCFQLVKLLQRSEAPPMF